MKKSVFVFLMCLPVVSLAQIEDHGITSSLYAGLSYLPNSFFEGIDVSYVHRKQHAFTLGPYFTRTLESSFHPGVHAGYQFFPGGTAREFNTFFAFDYLYFSGRFNAEPFGENETTRHILNVGFGATFFVRERIFLTANMGIGYARIKDEYADTATGKDGSWDAICAMLRLGIGYSFSK